MSLSAEPARLARRLFSLLYEIFLLAAVLMAGSLPFAVFAHGAGTIVARPLFQLYLICLAGTYFVWQWRRGGQTLAMKTWRMRLVSCEGGPLSLRRALCRFVLAFTGTLLFGVGFLWALADRERQFLHDRLAGTRIVDC